MATATTPTNPETALTVVEQDSERGMVEWNLDGFPEDRYNRIVPVATISIPTDLLRPVVQVVQLNPDAKAGGDVYQSNDMPAGHAAPTKVALRKLATAAGISFVDERRVDNGSDPDVIEITSKAEMLLPTGQRIQAVGTKRVDLNALKWASPEHRAKYKSFHLEHTASRAQNRAIRALLSLRGSYPVELYRRPFAIVSFAPNMDHPEIRSRMIEAMTGSAAALMGPAAAHQLEAGRTINVTPAAEEDPAPAQPTTLPGEKLAKAADDDATPEEPAWMRGAGDQAAATETKPDLAAAIRSQAEEGGLKGAATGPQVKKLQELFAAIGGKAITPGLLAIWPDLNVDELTSNQANAIIVAADSDPDFADHWRELAS